MLRLTAILMPSLPALWYLSCQMKSGLLWVYFSTSTRMWMKSLAYLCNNSRLLWSPSCSNSCNFHWCWHSRHFYHTLSRSSHIHQYLHTWYKTHIYSVHCRKSRYIQCELSQIDSEKLGWWFWSFDRLFLCVSNLSGNETNLLIDAESLDLRWQSSVGWMVIIPRGVIINGVS